MKRALLIIALASTGGCSKREAPPPPPAPPAAVTPTRAGPSGPDLRGLAWEALNANASLRIQQTARSEDDCEVRCVENASQQVRWTAKGCRGTSLDLRFASPDCSRLMVVHTLPSASAFRYAVLATVWTQDGVDYELQGGGLGVDPKRIAASGTSFRWLKGVLETPGERPHFTEDGSAIELESLDGSKHVIPFVPVRHR